MINDILHAVVTMLLAADIFPLVAAVVIVVVLQAFLRAIHFHLRPQNQQQVKN